MFLSQARTVFWNLLTKILCPFSVRIIKHSEKCMSHPFPQRCWIIEPTQLIQSRIDRGRLFHFSVKVLNCQIQNLNCLSALSQSRAFQAVMQRWCCQGTETPRWQLKPSASFSRQTGISFSPAAPQRRLLRALSSISFLILYSANKVYFCRSLIHLLWTSRCSCCLQTPISMHHLVLTLHCKKWNQQVCE